MHIFDMATKDDSPKIGVINSIIRLFSSNEILRTLISLATSVLSFLIAIFVAGPLIVGRKAVFPRKSYLSWHSYRKNGIFVQRTSFPTYPDNAYHGSIYFFVVFDYYRRYHKKPMNMK